MFNRNIEISVKGLAKNNNGFFKSEKQRDFLTDFLGKREGFIRSENGHNGYQIFCEWDNLGITKIYHITSKLKKTNVKFERQGSN